MKKILLALALMLPMVVFTACEKDKENEPGNGSGNELVGTWLTVDGQMSLRFNSDYTGVNEYLSDDYNRTFTFTWSVSDNRITMTNQYSQTVSYLYTIEGDLLTMIEDDNVDDDTVVLRRVK